MMWKLSIEAMCESENRSFLEHLAFYAEPDLEFSRLDDMVAFLDRVADATGVEAVREYAAQVKLEGDTTEKVVRRWGNRKAVTLEGEVKRAIAAVNDKAKAAKK